VDARRFFGEIFLLAPLFVCGQGWLIVDSLFACVGCVFLGLQAKFMALGLQ
jgi:hypothetical protein